MNLDVVIVFVGLMVQVNQPWSWDNTAVLPYADKHKAELVLPTAALVDPREISEEFKDYRQVNGYFLIPLQGYDVRLKGTRGMFNRRGQDYIDATTPLSRVGGCGRLLSDIRKRNQTEQIASFFDLRGGRMVPDTYLKQRISFDGTEFRNRCAVCSIRYEATIRGEEAVLVFTSMYGAVRRVRIRRGAQLVVRNVPNDKDSTGDHFQHLYSIYETCVDKLSPNPQDTTCPNCLCVDATAFPECVGFDEGDCPGRAGPRFPSTTDCTVVDHP